MYICSRNINEPVTQHAESLFSLVLQLHNDTVLANTSRVVVHKVMSSPINSRHGVKLSLDRPLNNL